MKFTIDLPLGLIEPEGEFQTAEAAASMGLALERAGASAGYVTDHPAPSSKWLHAGGHDATDPFTSLAFVAAATSTLKLHTNILVLPYRNPFVTAKSAATLQVFSRGRLILGVGAGYQRTEFEALGVEFTRRGALMDEALEVMNLAWRGGVVEKKGLTFEANGVEPRPLPKPLPKVWIGGGSDKAVERAARWGDGWSPFFTAPGLSASNQASAIQSLDHLKEKIGRLKELREEFGRTGEFDICIGPQGGLRSTGREDVERYLDDLGRLAETGVTWTSAGLPHKSRQAYLDGAQWLGEEIIRRV